MSTLKVGTIQDHTNSNTAISIDSSGHVLAPVNPKFSTQLAVSKASADYSSSATTPVPIDTEDFDIGNCVSISSDVATFTAPVTGYYQFNLTAIFSTVTTATVISTYYNVNGALTTSSQDEAYRVLDDPQGGGYFSSTNSQLIYVTSGQTVVPHLIVLGDTTVIVRDGTRFSGFLVP